jgi:hypothetical protein
MCALVDAHFQRNLASWWFASGEPGVSAWAAL